MKPTQMQEQILDNNSQEGFLIILFLLNCKDLKSYLIKE